MDDAPRVYETPADEGENRTEYYDYVILGTGLAETAVGCVLAQKEGVKILQIETNRTYGADLATLNYQELLAHFRVAPDAADERLLAQSRKFNIDLTPKLLLQDSPLKDFLLAHEIHEIVAFTSIPGSFLFTSKIHAIPTNEAQSLKSSVVSLLQKPRVIRFFWNVRSYARNPSMKMKPTMREEFAAFGINSDSMAFIGHAIALNLNDDYLGECPSKTYNRIIRYVSSIVCFDDTESPYIYPLYGLSELCQAFSRRSALHGTLFMLGAQLREIEGHRITVTDPNGAVHRVEAGRIISDPRYAPSPRISKQIIRCIMLLEKTSMTARNIIFLKSQLGRKSDVFCVVLGADEMACPPEYEVGILSTEKETTDPDAEIAPVLAKFNIIHRFVEVRNCLVAEDTESTLYTQSVDESPLMDNIYDDIESILQRLNT